MQSFDDDNDRAIQTILNSINSGSPVLIRGESATSGHVWVIDGHLRQSREITTQHMIGWWDGWQVHTPDPNCWCAQGMLFPKMTRTETSSLYLHNNWGWGETRRPPRVNEVLENGNGFFVAGSFAVRDRRLASDGTVGTPTGSTQNFNRHVYIFPNLRR